MLPSTHILKIVLLGSSFIPSAFGDMLEAKEASNVQSVKVAGKYFLPSLTVAASNLVEERGMKATVGSDIRASLLGPLDVRMDVTNVSASHNLAPQKLTMFPNGAKADYPIITADADQICQGLQFYDANGTVQIGTKICTVENDLAPCTTDSQINCRTTSVFKAVDISKILAENIKSGTTIFGVAGSVTPSPANCSSNGSQGCVATGSYYAATECVADSSNCFVPTYVASSKPLKAISYDAINTGKGSIRASLTFSGIAGELADCGGNGMVGCVTTATYKSGDLTNLSAGNIKKNVMVAGIIGDYPSSTNPLASNTVAVDLTTFGSGIPIGNYEFFDSTGNVYSATVADYGPVIPTTTPVTVSNASTLYRQVSVSGDANLSGSNVKSGTTIFGISGTVTPSPANCSSNGSQSCVATGSYYAAAECAADSSNCFVPSYVASTKPLKAISYDAINVGKSEFRTSLTLAGIAGTLGDCSANGSVGCVTTATYQSGDLTNLSAGNIKKNVTIAGIAGDYPSASYPLSGADTTTDLPAFSSTSGGSSYEWFQSDGTRITDSVAPNETVMPAPTTQLFNTGVYRQISVHGDANLAAGNIRSGTTIFGVAGSVAPESHSNCSTDGATACVTTGSFPAARLANFAAGDVKNGVSIAGVAGTGMLSCTGDGEQNCFVSGVFKAANVTGISTWDLRAGQTLAGVSGALKTNCRNTVNSAWNTGYPMTAIVDAVTDLLTVTAHGYASNTRVRVFASTAPTGLELWWTDYFVKVIDANTIQLSATSGPGTVVDIITNGANVTVAKSQDGTFNWWDTVDDWWGLWAERVAGWSSDTACGSATWEDRTTTDGGATLSTCADSPANCIQRDKISSLQVTKLISTALSWSKAIQACNDSTYGGYPAGTWRLPTPTEFMALFQHGIVSMISPNFITDAQKANSYWSSATYSYDTTAAWEWNLAFGKTLFSTKTMSNSVICVR